MDVQPAVLLHHRLFQHAVIDQALDEGDGAQLADQRGVEADLVEAFLDLSGAFRRARTFQWIENDQQHIARRTGIDQREEAGIAHIAAVPIGRSLDLDRLETLRQAGRSEHGIRIDLVAREDARPARFDIRRAEEKLEAGGMHGSKIDLVVDEAAQRIVVEGVEVIRAGDGLQRSSKGEPGRAEGAERSARLGDAAPERFKFPPRAFRAALGKTGGIGNGIHGAGGRGGDGGDVERLVLAQPVQHAPGIGAVGAAALQGETDGASFSVGLGHGGSFARAACPC